MHDKRNGFVYSNICLYITNSAEVTQNDHMTGSLPDSWWAISLATINFIVLWRGQPWVLRAGTNVLCSSNQGWRWYHCMTRLILWSSSSEMLPSSGGRDVDGDCNDSWQSVDNRPAHIDTHTLSLICTGVLRISLILISHFLSCFRRRPCLHYRGRRGRGFTADWIF